MNSSEIEKLLFELNGAFEHLPIENSPIAYEIVLTSMKYFCEKSELTLKVLFSNKNFTEMGARYHLDRLVKNGWLSISKSERDLRVKVVTPTQKLITSYQKYHNLHFDKSDD